MSPSPNELRILMSEKGAEAIYEAHGAPWGDTCESCAGSGMDASTEYACRTCAGEGILEPTEEQIEAAREYCQDTAALVIDATEMHFMVERFTDALIWYGRHHDGCLQAGERGARFPCSCGLSERIEFAVWPPPVPALSTAPDDALGPFDQAAS